MKKSFLFFSMLATWVFTSCSTNDLSSDGTVSKEEGSQFMAVEIVNPASTTRAEAPGEKDFEEGSDTENEVTSLRFYFFNDNGDAVPVTTAEQNYVDRTTGITAETDKDMPNVEKKLKAILVIEPNVKANVKKMVAIANFEAAKLGSSNLSFTELCSKVSETKTDGAKYDGQTKGSFMMTNSSYAGTDGQITMTTIDPEKHLKTSPTEAEANPVSIYIERILAKVRLYTNWNSDVTSQKVLLNNEEYTAIELKDKHGNNIKVTKGSGETATEEQVYVIFKNWNVTGTADRSYLIKKVNSTTAWNDLTTAWFWNDNSRTPAGYFRSYWAVNPTDLKLQYSSYKTIDKAIGTIKTENNTTITTDGGVAYCLENAADNYEKGTKSSYDPSTQTSNRTQVIIAGTLVTVEKKYDKNVATPLTLGQYANVKYAGEDAVKTAMLNTLSTPYYYKEGTEVKKIGPSHVKLVVAEAMTPAKADNKSEASKRYLCYLQLADNAPTTLYSDANGTTVASKENVNTALAGLGGAKVWNSGNTYYYVDIKHLGTTDTNGGIGVVRNHVYNVNVNSVVGLGTPVYDPETHPIIPQKPEDDESYIAAQVKILSWRIVNSNYDLKW